MKNKIVRLMISVAVLCSVTGVTVAAQNYTSGLSVGGAVEIDGGIVVADKTANTSVQSTTQSTPVASATNQTVTTTTTTNNATAASAEQTTASTESVKAEVSVAEQAVGTAEAVANEPTVPTYNGVTSLADILNAAMLAAQHDAAEVKEAEARAQIEASDMSKKEKVESEVNLDLEAEARAKEEAQAAQDAMVVSVGATFGTDISLPEEGEEEDEGETHYGYTNLGVAIVDDHLNIRETADDNSKIVGKMSNDCGCEILEIVDGKAHIVSGSVEGYVSADYILTGEVATTYASQIVKNLATVTANGLKVRAAADTESEVLKMVAYGEELEVIEEVDGWVKISVDGKEGYVSSEFVSVGENLKTALNISEFLYGDGVTDVRMELCEYAKQFLGNPYVWGGTSLTKGADCSGYVLSIYKKYGVSLPHSSRVQATMGTKVSVADARPGDLVFYSKGGRVNHVAIYIGGGQVIHASSPKYGIRITSVYYRTPTCVRRFNL